MSRKFKKWKTPPYDRIRLEDYKQLVYFISMELCRMSLQIPEDRDERLVRLMDDLSLAVDTDLGRIRCHGLNSSSVTQALKDCSTILKSRT